MKKKEQEIDKSKLRKREAQYEFQRSDNQYKKLKTARAIKILHCNRIKIK